MDEIQITQNKLNGFVFYPKNPIGLVLFAHGSGSSRLSIRNQFVASYLEKNNIASVLFDLLTEEEDQKDNITAEYRFDIDLLSKRLIEATNWAEQTYPDLSLGYFGASTGAAAALIAASETQEKIKAIVSRGGRPDLAGSYLKKVISPTLLLVGSNDLEVIELNKIAYNQMSCEKELVLIERATHLFEEEGTLEQVADKAASWFIKHL